jgi:hypothetical protein
MNGTVILTIIFLAVILLAFAAIFAPAVGVDTKLPDWIELSRKPVHGAACVAGQPEPVAAA